MAAVQAASRCRSCDCAAAASAAINLPPPQFIIFTARAAGAWLYKRPKVLLLDEATSALDVALEKAVNANVARLGITRIIVAHRPETIASAGRR